MDMHTNYRRVSLIIHHSPWKPTFLHPLLVVLISNISDERLSRTQRQGPHHLYLQEIVCNHLQTNGRRQQSVYGELNRYRYDLKFKLYSHEPQYQEGKRQ